MRTFSTPEDCRGEALRLREALQRARHGLARRAPFTFNDNWF